MLSVKKLSKSYSDRIILQNLTFSVKKGEILAVLGESGSGKTTLLQLIAGLAEPDSGEIRLGREKIKPPSQKLVAGHDKIKIVQQDFQLFPNFSVRENIAYPLRRYEKNYIQQRCDELITFLQLEKIQDQLPKEISGGEKQRTAIAQALADEPKVLLLDEPFSQLDLKNRQKLKAEIHKLIKTLKISCIFVTHDVSDATELADRLVLLQEGVLLENWEPL